MKNDSTSEYYRICPGCDKDFMANHMLEKFCSKKCKYRYHNKIKKQKRDKVGFIAERNYKYYVILHKCFCWEQTEISISYLINYKGLNLNHCITKKEVPDNGEIGFYFVDYALYYISERKVKIIKHDNTF